MGNPQNAGRTFLTPWVRVTVIPTPNIMVNLTVILTLTLVPESGTGVLRIT